MKTDPNQLEDADAEIAMLKNALDIARNQYLDQCCETSAVREERDSYKHQAVAAHTFLGELIRECPAAKVRCENFIATAIAANS